MSSKAKREEEIKEFIQAVELFFSEKGQRLYQYFDSQSLAPDESARLDEFSHRVHQPLSGSSSALKTRGASAIYSPAPESTATAKATVGARDPYVRKGVSVVIPVRPVTPSQVSTAPNDDHSGADIAMHGVSPTLPPMESNSADTNDDWLSPLIRRNKDPINDPADSPEAEPSNQFKPHTRPDDDPLYDPASAPGDFDEDGFRFSFASNVSEELAERTLHDDGAGIVTTKPKRGRPHKYPQSNSGGPHNNSWRPMIDISEIKLHHKFERLIRDMSDKSGADIATSVFAGCKTQCVPIIQYEKPNHKMLAKLCLKLIKMSPTKQTKGKGSKSFALFEHLVWCFHTLAVGDLVADMLGEEVTVRSQNSTRMRLEHTVAREHRQRVADGLTVACNMFFVCREFGVGTLFFFAIDLTKHFLKDLVTKRGDKFDAMKRNFATHGFKELIDESGATKVGAAMRDHLKGVYKLDQLELESDTSDESDIESQTSNQSNPDEGMVTATDFSSTHGQEHGESHMDESEGLP